MDQAEFLTYDWPITTAQRDEILDRLRRCGFNVDKPTHSACDALLGAKIALLVTTGTSERPNVGA